MRRATTSSRSSSSSPPWRWCSMPLEPLGRGPPAARRGADRRRPRGRAGRRNQAQLPPPGLRARWSGSRWPRRDGARLAVPRARRPRRARRGRLLVPAEPRPHRQPAALVHRLRPDLPSRPRPDPRRPRRPQRPRLPRPTARSGRNGCCRASTTASPSSGRSLAPSPSPASSSPSARAPTPLLRVAGAVGLAAALAWLDRPDLRLRPRRNAPRLRIGPPIPRAGPHSRHGPASHRREQAGFVGRAHGILRTGGYSKCRPH